MGIYASRHRSSFSLRLSVGDTPLSPIQPVERRPPSIVSSLTLFHPRHLGNSHGYRHEMLGTRSKSSDDVPSWIEMALALSGYWLGATFTWLGDRKCGRSSQL